MLWGHTLRSPHAHARIRAIDLSAALDDARRARGAHARRRARPEDVRARVLRPAGARDRPRSVLRRAGRDRRRRASGAGAPRRGAHRRRLRAAPAGRGPGARDRVGAAAPGPRDARDRPLPRRSAPERRPLDAHRPRRSGAFAATSSSRGRTRSGRRTRRSSAPSRGSRSPTARAASTSTSRRSGCTSTASRSPRASALPEEQVRIHLAGVGGAFGGREDLSIQIHAALLALHTSRPVKMVYNRQESFTGHVHRHPARIHAEHHATRDGRLVCVKMQILLDGGAYASSSTAVTANATSFACGPYAVPNALIETTCVFTNNPPCGAMRGFGAVQTCFAARGADGQARAARSSSTRSSCACGTRSRPATRCRRASGSTARCRWPR